MTLHRNPAQQILTLSSSQTKPPEDEEL